jgi:hypothetical protein
LGQIDLMDPKLLRNVAFFTVTLLILTLLIEQVQKGRIQIEQPLVFGGAILILGFVGGWILTWLAKSKNK